MSRPKGTAPQAAIEAVKKRWQDPHYRAATLARLHTPEARAKSLRNSMTKEARARARAAQALWLSKRNEEMGRSSWAPEMFRVHQLLQDKRTAAKHDNIRFSITLEDLLPLPERCPVLGITISYKASSKNTKGKSGGALHRPAMASIDRIIPRLGYVPGNVQVVSYRANYVKGNGTEHEHRLVAEYLRRRTR